MCDVQVVNEVSGRKSTWLLKRRKYIFSSDIKSLLNAAPTDAVLELKHKITSAFKSDVTLYPRTGDYQAVGRTAQKPWVYVYNDNTLE